MVHYMNLHNKPFESIKSGSKTLELRLLDEKRQLINIGDFIEFTNRTTNEKLTVKVIALHKFKNFEELFNAFPKTAMGYSENEIAHFSDMEEFYPKEEQQKYGVVAIEIKKQ